MLGQAETYSVFGVTDGDEATLRASNAMTGLEEVNVKPCLNWKGSLDLWMVVRLEA